MRPPNNRLQQTARWQFAAPLLNRVLGGHEKARTSGRMIAVGVALLLLHGASATPSTRPVSGPRVDCGFIGAKRTKFVAPVYPETAVEARKSGDVVIEVMVTDTGKTGKARVKKSVDPELDQAALDAVRQWEYEPVLVGGKAQQFVLTVSVKFRLPRARP